MNADEDRKQNQKYIRKGNFSWGERLWRMG